ncbi:MAG TPA: hypothetical protein EYH45_07690 [Candidatus Caldiarchaeum subterraneum]|uniref:Uncharacterized protein n=1 Tax=Caldiarchaeum subterraneum TaxID=311458 RepID=A0A833ED36_CALS0|nr:hypothetical protein [Candidatus Caldarchaeum subterraneum]
MQRKTIETSAILLFSLILAILLLTNFTAVSPLATKAEVEQEQLLEITDAKANLVELIIKVEHKMGDFSKPVDKMLVRIGDRVTITNKDGVAVFLVSPMVYTVTVSSPENKLPTWSGEIPVSASKTLLSLTYTELRAEITRIDSLIDYENETTMVTLSVILPSYKQQENHRIYAGSPVLYYIDDSYKPRVALYNHIYAAEEYTGQYIGTFNPVTPKGVNSSYTTTQNINDIAMLILTSKSYLPVFFVESVVVEVRVNE